MREQESGITAAENVPAKPGSGSLSPYAISNIHGPPVIDLSTEEEENSVCMYTYYVLICSK